MKTKRKRVAAWAIVAAIVVIAVILAARLLRGVDVVGYLKMLHGG